MTATGGEELLLLAAEDLAVYTVANWPGFVMAKHHEMVVEKLEAVRRGEIGRLMIFMPLRHGKSALASEPILDVLFGPTRLRLSEPTAVVSDEGPGVSGDSVGGAGGLQLRVKFMSLRIQNKEPAIEVCRPRASLDRYGCHNIRRICRNRLPNVLWSRRGCPISVM